MLNPDGVIEGNYRCNLTGNDLNRQWNNPDKDKYPTIYYTKKLILSIANSSSTILLYCDMHGHSKIKNMVLYGCSLTQCDDQCIPYALKQKKKKKKNEKKKEDEVIVTQEEIEIKEEISPEEEEEEEEEKKKRCCLLCLS
jgi:hypothetical protein